MTDAVRSHYETFPYPFYSLLASVRTCDTYALNVPSLWARANGQLPPDRQRILLAGCGSFSPYPTSLANPDAHITALDLSLANLRRARIHALIRGRRNITYKQGDLLDKAEGSGPFHFIDAFGVLHHMPDPVSGLQALEHRLAPGGVIRIMVYSRSERREAESVRRALQLLGVRDIAAVKSLIRRADKSSRLYRLISSSSETGFDAGLADMVLHPCVTTFRVDQLLEMIGRAGLTPLLFAHSGALPEVSEEVERLRRLEKDGLLECNFTAYLGRKPALTWKELPENTSVMLNPAIRKCVGFFRLGNMRIAPKLGFENPVLDRQAKKFLRKFLEPRPLSGLTAAERKEAELFFRPLFLVGLWK